MTDTEDIVEDDIAPEASLDADTDSTDARKEPYQIWIFVLIGAAFLGHVLSMGLNKKSPDDSLVSTETSQSIEAYSLILSEDRPDVRLVRLEDFMKSYPDNTNAETVRQQKIILREYEEIAWSKLTDTLFDIKADEPTKLAALETYKNGWGTLLRADQLARFTSTDEDEEAGTIKPITKKSKFAKGGPAGDLVGAPVVRIPLPPPPPVRQRPPEKLETLDIVAARVKSKKSPTYPRNAKRRKVPGFVTLALDIDRRGRVVDTRVISVQANRYERDFVKAATRAAQRTRFHPKTVNGRPVPTRGFIQKYAFRVSR